MTEWRIIEEFPLYSVSEDGRVMRTGKGRFQPSSKILKGWPDRDGRRCYSFRCDGKKVNCKGYLLVAVAFLGPRPAPGLEVCHCDNTKTNDHWRNLRWDTRASNEADKRLVCTDNSGERHGLSKLKIEQVNEIVRLYARANLSQREIAGRYGLHQVTVSQIVRGKRWIYARQRAELSAST